jgi:uncharacterized Zn finger protein
MENKINPFDFKNVMNQLSAILPKFCDKCGHKHDSDDFDIVATEQNNATCKLSCKNCGNMYMMQVHSPAPGVLSAQKTGFKTEISSKEMDKFKEADQIHSDDIIDAYNGLKKVKTIDDFRKLF